MCAIMETPLLERGSTMPKNMIEFQNVREFPKDRAKPSTRNSKYGAITEAVAEGKIVLVAWDKIGKPGQSRGEKATLIRQACERRKIRVAVSAQEEGCYVALQDVAAKARAEGGAEEEQIVEAAPAPKKRPVFRSKVGA